MTARRHAWAAAIVALLAYGLTGSPAHAETKECKLDPDTGLLKCTIVAQPLPPRTVDIPGVPLVWKRYPYVDSDGISRGICTRNVAGVFEIGVTYIVSLTNTETGEQLLLYSVCTFSDETPPQPPPPPPTPGELLDDQGWALAVPPALSPTSDIGGLTGLESWLWCADPGEVPVDVSLRGWTAEATVQVVQLEWAITGPSGTTRTSSSCGTEAEPSARWTPETMGEHSISLTAEWAGVWELTYDGTPMGAFPLGPVPLTGPATPYMVDEYRGRLSE